MGFINIRSDHFLMSHFKKKLIPFPFVLLAYFADKVFYLEHFDIGLFPKTIDPFLLQFLPLDLNQFLFDNAPDF